MEKIFYVVTAPVGSELEEFVESLITTIGPDAAKELPDGSVVRARVRFPTEPGASASAWEARVRHGNEELLVDSVLDVVLPGGESSLEGLHAVLDARTSTYQGWRVSETVFVDNRVDPERGVMSDYVGGGAFLQRVPGYTREQFSIGWHLHAAHMMGGVEDGTRPMPLRYIQNRVIEPVTPTMWVLDGYEEAGSPLERFLGMRAVAAESPAKPLKFADIAKGPGEKQFFRMPAPVLFGREVVIAC